VNDQVNDDAQAQMVKQWWSKYGTTVIVGVILAILMVYGLRYWQGQKHNVAGTASRLYDQYQEALTAGDIEAQTALTAKLKSDYKRTPYATAVALINAAQQVRANAYNDATATLDWVITEGHEYAKPLARLRMAEIKLQQQDYDAAIALLSQPTSTAYEPAYLEAQGDVYFAKGDVNAAVELYTQALAGFREQGFDNVLLQYKLQTYAPTDSAGDA